MAGFRYDRAGSSPEFPDDELAGIACPTLLLLGDREKITTRPQRPARPTPHPARRRPDHARRRPPAGDAATGHRQPAGRQPRSGAMRRLIVQTPNPRHGTGRAVAADGVDLHGSTPPAAPVLPVRLRLQLARRADPVRSLAPARGGRGPVHHRGPDLRCRDDDGPSSRVVRAWHAFGHGCACGESARAGTRWPSC